ncbi:MAG: ATP-binding protein, partial [Saprospiraceae bacterium]
MTLMPCLRSLCFFPLLFCMLASHSLLSQELPIKHLGSKDGLSMDYVTTLFQDSRGYIWMGTFFGLNRYDGNEIKAYRPNHLDPWALHGNQVNWILEDPHGLLWIGMDNGLAILDPYTERFIHLDQIGGGTPIHEVRKALLDKTGKVWFYQGSRNGHRLLGLQTNASIKAQIRKGIRPTDFRIHQIPLSDDFDGGINALIHNSDSTCIAINFQGKCTAVNLVQKTTAQEEIVRVAIPLSESVQIFPEPLRNSGALLLPGHTFQNGLHLDQMHQYLQLPDGGYLVFRFFDKKIYRINRLEDFKSLTGESPLDQLPVFYELEHPSTFSRLIDRNGDLWIGTTGYGVLRIPSKIKGFSQLAQGNSLYNFATLPGNRLWMGYLAPETILDLRTQEITKAPWNAFIQPGQQVKAVLTNRKGAMAYLVLQSKNTPLLQVLQYSFNTGKIRTLPQQQLLTVGETPPCVKEDKDGNIWISGNQGRLLRYSPKADTFSAWTLDRFFPNEIARQLTTTNLLQTRSGSIWIANNYGLVKIDGPLRENPSFKAFHNYSGKKKIFANNGIFALCEDPHDDDVLWLGTLGNGLAKFHLPSETVSYLDQQDDPLNGKIVLGIVPDNNYRFWISTDQGVSCFDPALQQFLSYDLQQALLESPYNATSFGKISENEILFGNANGLVVLHPSQLLDESPQPLSHTLQISRVRVNALSLEELLEQGSLSFTSDETMQLWLNHTENNITIYFAAPFARNPGSLYYRYKVEGLGNQWVSLGKQRSISLTGLSPGKYRVRVQVATPGDNPSTTLQTARLLIQIHPPWYRTRFAYLCYLLLLGIALRAWVLFDRKRIAEKYEADVKQQEVKRLQSLDQFKNKIFAYIAHEVKTPLSIIMGVSAKLRQQSPSGQSPSYLDAIEYEGRNLQGLVDEMIDITRLQEGSLQLNYLHGDMAHFLENTLSAYQPLAEFRDIQLIFHANPAEIPADFDPTRVKHILNNLINNALRHTPAQGTIRLSLSQPRPDEVQIIVSDTGAGIPEAELPFIFEKYFQGVASKKDEHRFGLGLSYVKDLVEWMQGSISVSSTPHTGTAFTICLPVKTPLETVLPNYLPSDYPTYSALPDTAPSSDELPLLLIVEDNPMLVSVLKLTLQPHFRLLISRDGKEGAELATREIPDLILSDIVMPEMDGLEMIQLLKNQPLTAHIPIVALSAKNEAQDRLQGQAIGADAYIGKPFSAP